MIVIAGIAFAAVLVLVAFFLGAYAVTETAERKVGYWMVRALLSEQKLREQDLERDVESAFR